MAEYFRKELHKIRSMILSMGTMVEKRVHMSKQAIEEIDKKTARTIIESDIEIDEMEVEIEEECLKALALYQPVAVDLRFLVAVIKINNELERIGDQAVNIAERVIILAKQKNTGFVFDYSVMCNKTSLMLKKSLDAIVNLDIEIAMQVCQADEQVDAIKSQAYDIIKKRIEQNPENIGKLLNLFLVSRHLERIGDHATNIAEEVIYMIEGEIVRHGMP